MESTANLTPHMEEMVRSWLITPALSHRFEFDFETLERVKVKQAFKYPVTLDMEPFVEGRAWVGNDNSDESQVRVCSKTTCFKV